MHSFCLGFFVGCVCVFEVGVIVSDGEVLNRRSYQVGGLLHSFIQYWQAVAYIVCVEVEPGL